MAEGSENSLDNYQSVETDAAPSVNYMRLDNLDIGSECEIKTESKAGECLQEENGVASSEVNRDENFQPAAASNAQNGDRNLEAGLGSLNLTEEVIPAVDDSDIVYADELLHQDNDGDTLLHLAILFLQRELALAIIHVMVDIGAILDVQNNLHQSFLHLAVLTRQPEVVECLLQNGAPVSQRDNKLRTSMFIACEENDNEMLELMLQYCSSYVPDKETVSKLLNPEVNPLDLPNEDGERCLHLAVRHNNIEMAGKLINNGANPNLPDRKSGRTALHEAADLGHVEMVRFLISQEEVDVNEVTYNDETALEIAHMRDRKEVVSLLKHMSFPITKRKTKPDDR